MKPPPFEYARPLTVDDAVELLATRGPEARPLAGGQSLVPILNFRMARPSLLVDLNFVDELRRITITDEVVRVGAMARQRTLEIDPGIVAATPLLPAALAHVGHLPNRNRGTLGGSVAHADPAAELPAVMIALDATMTVRGPDGERKVDASDFFVGPFTTTLEPGELLVEAAWPRRRSDRVSVREVSRRAGDFAIVGIAGVRSGDQIRVTAFGTGATPLRLRSAELSRVEANPEAIAGAASRAAEEVDPLGDIHGSADYRRHLVHVLVTRTLRDLAA